MVPLQKIEVEKHGLQVMTSYDVSNSIKNEWHTISSIVWTATGNLKIESVESLILLVSQEVVLGPLLRNQEEKNVKPS